MPKPLDKQGTLFMELAWMLCRVDSLWDNSCACPQVEHPEAQGRRKTLPHQTNDGPGARSTLRGCVAQVRIGWQTIPWGFMESVP